MDMQLLQAHCSLRSHVMNGRLGAETQDAVAFSCIKFKWATGTAQICRLLRPSYGAAQRAKAAVQYIWIFAEVQASDWPNHLLSSHRTLSQARRCSRLSSMIVDLIDEIAINRSADAREEVVREPWRQCGYFIERRNHIDRKGMVEDR